MHNHTLTLGRLARYMLALILALCIAFIYLDHRVEKITATAKVGDVLHVSSDVCNRLRTKKYIAADTHCGYRRGNIKVVITRAAE